MKCFLEDPVSLPLRRKGKKALNPLLGDRKKISDSHFKRLEMIILEYFTTVNCQIDMKKKYINGEDS
jgi:hypothetical protein